ncbi:hypothetical protein [Dyella psychrodurans]|uniref:Uncharacterized protein n=1 Tax=Dyella psychrodurans TaxID=1927960 RepID=A0A370XC15_9GAMM|nr:hypothetical protein [Dyella psychrodurans]RDS85842.1 hypothetical protein DWU99_00785 [Dyella psychrodurans]
MRPLIIDRSAVRRRTPLTSWPAPNPVPSGTLILAGVLALGCAALIQAHIPALPVVLLGGPLLLFGCHAERQDYRREKRNYDGWNADMARMVAPTSPDRWSANLDAVRRRRRPVAQR